MRESQFTAALGKELTKRGLYVLKNNNAYTAGVADCWYSGRLDLWTEHKFFSKLPPMIDLSKESITSRLQQNWLIARYKEGRNIGMIVGYLEPGMRESRGLFLPGLEWQRPILRAEFRAQAKNKKQLAAELIELLGPIEGPILP